MLLIIIRFIFIHQLVIFIYFIFSSRKSFYSWSLNIFVSNLRRVIKEVFGASSFFSEHYWPLGKSSLATDNTVYHRSLSCKSSLEEKIQGPVTWFLPGIAAWGFSALTTGEPFPLMKLFFIFENKYIYILNGIVKRTFLRKKYIMWRNLNCYIAYPYVSLSLTI